MITQEQLIQELILLLQKQQVSFKNNSLMLGDGTTLSFPSTPATSVIRKTVITYR